MELLRNTFLSILFFTYQFEIRHGVEASNHKQEAILNSTRQHGDSNPHRQTFEDNSLVQTMMRITKHTNKYLTIFDVDNTADINVILGENLLHNKYDNCHLQSATTNHPVINCSWTTQKTPRMLTIKTVTSDPTYLSLAVHDEQMELTNPLESIDEVCGEFFDWCLNRYPNKVCNECENLCSGHDPRQTTKSYESTTNESKGAYDEYKGKCRESGGVDIIPIVIASIVSFIAGIVACLLALCLLRHCRKRSCFKSSTSDDGSSKPKQETFKGLQAQSKGKNIPEHIGLQDVNPKIRTELGAKRPQPSAPQQVIVYETSDKRRSEHVYSELGNKPTNGPGEYESTFPNRSSDHVYQGIQGNTNPDIPSRHQTNELPENERGTKGHINGAMGQDRDPISETDGADGCYSQKHDYFVLEKENHKPNESEMSAGTKSNGQGFLSGSLQSEPDDKNTQHNDYFVLEKETHNPNESGTSAGTMSDGQGRLNDSLQSEPDDKNTEHNEYFVLEKENKAVNEVERVEDIKIDDTHLEADDDVDDDYHSYHVLEKQ